MIKTKKQFIVYTTIFVCAQIILSHFIQRTSALTYSILTLSSVMLALVYVILSSENTPFHTIMLGALSATVAADFFLTELVTFEGQKLVAMCFFCVTQACYFLRIYREHQTNRAKKVHLYVQGGVILFALILTVIVLKGNTNALSLISMFYFANLTMNLVFAFIQIKLSILFPLGLLFFLLCDILVGLNEMASSFIPIAESSFVYKLIHSGVNLAWIFYVPSQTLLAISTHENKG